MKNSRSPSHHSKGGMNGSASPSSTPTVPSVAPSVTTNNNEGKLSVYIYINTLLNCLLLYELKRTNSCS